MMPASHDIDRAPVSGCDGARPASTSRWWWAILLWGMVWGLPSAGARAERIELDDGSVLMGSEVNTKGETVTIHLDIGQMIAVPRAHIVHRGDPATSPLVTAAPLRFHGSNAMGERLVPALVDHFVASHGAAASPWLVGELAGEKTLIVHGGEAGLPHEIEVRAFGSNTAFAALQTGAADIGLSARPIRDSESAVLRGLTEQGVALDGIAVIVNPSNPLRSVTLAQLAKILSGEIADWSLIGGAPGPIHVRLPDDRSSLPETLQTLVLAGRRLTPAAERVESSQDLSARVAAEPGAIGLVSLAYVDQTRALDIRSCSGEVGPTAFSVKSGDYPLTRRLFLYARPQPRPKVIDDLLAFAVSSAGQSAIAAAGFVNQEIESDNGVTRRTRRQMMIDDASIDFGLARNFLKITEGASRLSLTFQFDEGGVAPAGTADDDIRRLIAFMKSPVGSGHQILVLGFSGPTDILQQGTALSENRAREVAARLTKSGLKVSVAAGFGPITAPCTETPDTRERSRRVEVWMR